MRNLFFAFVSVLLLASCGGNSTSGAQVDESEAGTMTPADFVGVYRGTLTVTAEAASISKTDTFDITVTVTADGMVRFDGDEPNETFTAGLTDSGSFSGNLFINEDECDGTVGVTGSISGNTVSGDVTGDGACEEGALDIDVDLNGTFSASK